MAIESYVHNGPAGVRLRPHHWRVSGVFMECTLVVPHGTDISIIEREYPDLCNDEISEDGDVYFIGKPSDEEPDEDDEESGERLDYDEAIEFCGYCEGAIEEADACIDGNGPWVQGQLRETDFSHLKDAGDRAERERCSKLWHEAFERGKLSR